LAWYDRHRRDLPWRRKPQDAYAQWVAEVMLQQTRVETVLDYYDRFLARFPDIRTLASADHDEVLRVWQGLGYYRRALHLHRGAQLLTANRAPWPRTPAELRRLPGIGTYTAAALASIVFNYPAAAVDGNVARVLSRLRGITADVRSTATRTRIQCIADQLLSRNRPGDFNQAWMDLGSAVCTPLNPRCGSCPLASHCKARQRGWAAKLPSRSGARRTKVVTLSVVSAVFVNNGKVLVRKRPLEGMWSGLWEFPNSFVEETFNPMEILRGLAKEAFARPAGRMSFVGSLRHELSHRSLTFNVYTQSVTCHRKLDTARQKWVTEKGLQRISLSTAQRRVFELFRESRKGVKERS
jgi:A/G-specific adenine glycosylase